MTAYVHIGTPKTGTTSIQNFLYYNNHLLEKQNIRYAQSIVSTVLNEVEYQHWYLVTLYQEINLNYENKNFNIDSFLEDYPKWNELKHEINNYKNFNFIFSSEGISLRISENTNKALEIFNTIFFKLGFSKIRYICYIRNQSDMKVSWDSMRVCCGCKEDMGDFLIKADNNPLAIFNYKELLLCFTNKNNLAKLTLNIFNQNEFYQGDLLKDFIHNIGLHWDKDFKYPDYTNETLNLLGFEILSRINKLIEQPRASLALYRKHFKFKDKNLIYQPPKDIYQSYINYFKKSNEWVRKEFFPHKERLFPKKDLTNYKENYELKEMKPEYWDKIAEFVADIISTKNKEIVQNKQQIQAKNQTILDKNNLINSQNNQIKSLQDGIQNKLTKIQNLNQTILDKNNLINSQNNQIKSLQDGIQNKLTKIQNLNQTILDKNNLINSQNNQIKSLQDGIQNKLTKIQNLNQTILDKNNLINSQNNQIKSLQDGIQKKTGLLSFQTQYGTAKSRIQNQLSYKLGQTMIINSKNIFGVLFMPVYIISTLLSHRQEKKIYQEKIKKNPNLKLPPLESYPDYKEALKEKECLTYKLGEALIKANKTWYKGGYVKLIFEIGKLKRD